MPNKFDLNVKRAECRTSEYALELKKVYLNVLAASGGFDKEITSEYSIIKSGHVLLELLFHLRCETKDNF